MNDEDKVRTAILLDARHMKWVKDSAINFSSWVRKKIDQEMGG